MILYPPIIDESQVAFVKANQDATNQTLTIKYFSQNANESEDILVQAIDPRTSESLFSSGAVMEKISSTGVEDQRQVIISLKKNYSVVQINLISLEADATPTAQNGDYLNWYNNNKDEHSIMSKAVLFSFIAEPVLTIISPIEEQVLNQNTLRIMGLLLSSDDYIDLYSVDLYSVVPSSFSNYSGEINKIELNQENQNIIIKKYFGYPCYSNYSGEGESNMGYGDIQSCYPIEIKDSYENSLWVAPQFLPPLFGYGPPSKSQIAEFNPSESFPTDEKYYNYIYITANNKVMYHQGCDVIYSGSNNGYLNIQEHINQLVENGFIILNAYYATASEWTIVYAVDKLDYELTELSVEDFSFISTSNSIILNYRSLEENYGWIEDRTPFKIELAFLETILEKSEKNIYPKNINEIDYLLNYNFLLSQNNNFNLILNYETKKGYKNFKQINFSTLSFSPFGNEEDISLSFQIKENSDILKKVAFNWNAKNKGEILLQEVRIFKEEAGLYQEKPLITDSLDEWIDSIMYFKAITPYKYIFIFKYKKNDNIYYLKKEQTVSFSLRDMMLSTPENTFTIKYNPDLTGLKYNIVDTVTPTLGGTYPFIKRNGHQNYRTFTINGLISCLAEEESYNTYEEMMYKERQYRDKLIKFLYADDIKLFRSNQEGNIFAKLTNVSLTPNKQLDRNIYSFSASVVEVVEFNETNLIKYNFSLPLPNINKTVFVYDELDDGTLKIEEIKSIKSPILELPVKDEHTGKNITAIGKDAFNKSGKDVLSLSIPSEIAVIERGALSECIRLKELILESTIFRESGEPNDDQCLNYLFGGTESNNDGTILVPDTLKTIILNNVNYVQYAFLQNCSSLEQVIFNKVQNIAGSCCYNCVNLKEIVIKEGTYTIGPWSFSNCFNLTKVYFPKTLTTIGGDLFNIYGTSDEMTLQEIYYAGTKTDWSSIDKGTNWAPPSLTTIHCTDGDMAP